MKFARKAPVFAALATTSVLLLAACGGGSSGGSSSTSSGSSGTGISGSGFGSVPAESGEPKAGQTINIAAAQHRADLDLPGHSGRQQFGLHRLRLH